jgi:hypothetical protein
VTFPLGASLQSKSKFSVTELGYEYAFVKRPTWEIGASIGIHYISYSISLSGQGSCGGTSCPPEPATFQTETGSAKGPLPVFGLSGQWEFHPTWYLDGQVQYFGIKIDNVDASLSDFRVSVIKMFNPHIGLGAGWDQFTVRADVSQSRFQGHLDWGYGGAQVFVTGAF